MIHHLGYLQLFLETYVQYSTPISLGSQLPFHAFLHFCELCEHLDSCIYPSPHRHMHRTKITKIKYNKWLILFTRITYA